MTDPEKYYKRIAESLEGVEMSQMFGKPCLKLNGKAFAAFFQDEMVFKLQGEAHQEALNLQGAKLFDPSGKGRPMKEWVQVPFKWKAKWKDLVEKAVTILNK